MEISTKHQYEEKIFGRNFLFMNCSQEGLKEKKKVCIQLLQKSNVCTPQRVFLWVWYSDHILFFFQICSDPSVVTSDLGPPSSAEKPLDIKQPPMSTDIVSVSDFVKATTSQIPDVHDISPSGGPLGMDNMRLYCVHIALSPIILSYLYPNANPEINPNQISWKVISMLLALCPLWFWGSLFFLLK